MEAAHIWGMVAFMRQLPEVSADQYRELIEAREGHSHGPAKHAETDLHADGSQHDN